MGRCFKPRAPRGILSLGRCPFREQPTVIKGLWLNVANSAGTHVNTSTLEAAYQKAWKDCASAASSP